MKLTLPSKNKNYIFRYSDFLGSDFSGNYGDVSGRRSADCLNVYSQGGNIRTRNGLRKIFYNACTEFDVGAVNAMMYDGEDMYVHFGQYLMKYTAFPGTATFFLPTDGGMDGMYIIGAVMNGGRSDSFVFRDRMYILDGRKYMYVDENSSIGFVDLDSAYIPTTRINSDPTGLGGVTYQERNVLSPYRRNSFVSDGESFMYVLDCKNIEEGSITATVNGEDIYDFSADYIEGRVIFRTPPSLPETEGADNVLITFSCGTDNSDRINKCTVAKIFDNRVFLTGNEDYPGFIFHSEFEDATYFAESAFYDDGEDNIPVKSLITSGGCLVAVKEPGGVGGKVFVHTPVIDYNLGKVYPVTDTPIYVGAAGEGINYNDEMIYLSERGLEAIKISGNTFSVSHRSFFIDGKLKEYSREELNNSKLVTYKQNLLMIIDGDVFFTDGICRESVNGSGQYEWFLWEFAMDEKILGGKEIDGELYFYSEKGNIFHYDGYYDDGAFVESYWKTPVDHLGAESYEKSFSKKGSFIRCRITDDGKISVYADTDKNENMRIGEFPIGKFSFEKPDFGNLCFLTRGEVVIHLKNMPRNFGSVSFTVCSKTHPFNISGIEGNFYIKKYI